MPSHGPVPEPLAVADRRFEASARPQTVVDTTGRLVAANPAFCALTGHSREQLVGRHVSELNHAQDPGAADDVLPDVLAGRCETVQVQRVVRHATGRPVPVLLDVVVERDDDERVTGASAVAYDLRPLHDLERRQQQQEEFFLALSRRATDLALVADADGQLLYASPAVRHVLGYEPQDVVALSGFDFVHPDDVEAARQAYARAVEGGSVTFEVRVRDAAGRWRWLEETATNLLDTPVGGLVCNLRDVTERIEAEQALRRSETRYRVIADTAEEGIWAVAPDGGTLYANQRAAAILGLDLPALYARPAAELLGAAGAPEAAERLQSPGTRGVERFETGYLHPDGRERRLRVAASPLADEHGRVEGSLAMVSDVTDARRVEQELRRAVLLDALTGLPNRTLLLDRLEHALARETVGTAVVLLDLDQFKVVNDARGHAAGDALLVEVAARLRDAVRPSDTLGRIGGDEFAVVCEDVDPSEACVLAQEVLAGLTGPVELEGGTVHVRASVGVAASPGSAQDLLRYADAALFDAKRSGRNRVRSFSRPLAEQAERADALAADLRAALAADALVLHHQPVVDLQSGALLGVEALARWDSPTHGAVPPGVFVPVADLAGLGPELDAWAVGRALGDARALRDAGALPASGSVAVNLSARDLADGRLERVLLDACETTGQAPEQVVLEITETVMMDDPEETGRMLAGLRAHGFQIAVDDFGTGYSSLAYLRRLPVTALKIDRSFVSELGQDHDALAVVASIVDLARAVGLTTVAEGVETEQQAALLRRLGCQAGQGWLWSAAVPVDQLAGRPAAEAFPVPPPGRPRPPRRPATVGAEHGLDRLLDLHRSGASLATVAAVLNREGFRTPAGLRWKHTSVANAVAEAAYPGLADGG